VFSYARFISRVAPEAFGAVPAETQGGCEPNAGAAKMSRGQGWRPMNIGEHLELPSGKLT